MNGPPFPLVDPLFPYVNVESIWSFSKPTLTDGEKGLECSQDMKNVVLTNGKMILPKKKVYCAAYGVALLPVRRQTEEVMVRHSQGTTLITRQAREGPKGGFLPHLGKRDRIVTENRARCREEHSLAFGT